MVDTMSVTFTNPVQESLNEFRTLAVRQVLVEEPLIVSPTQRIETEQLTVKGITYDFPQGIGPTHPDILNPTAGHYSTMSDSRGFDYLLPDGESIDVAFYALGDGEYEGDAGVEWYRTYYDDGVGGQITDIWDALRVNEGPVAPYVGSNVLEIAIDEGANYFIQPIDVVYIPMSRMMWKDKPHPEPS